MKLRTQVRDFGEGVFAVQGDFTLDASMDDQLEHDAMAAHALLQAMDEFHPSNEAARASFDLAKKRAAEILAGWLGEE